MGIKIKIHKSYRLVVAICDSDIFGKKFEEGIRQLDITSNFFNGTEYDDEEALKIMKTELAEDATFNIAGEKAIELAIEAGLISEDSISYIEKVPFALKLL